MNRIKLLRTNSNISQEELANRLGLSKGMISLYENEERKPSYDILVKMSEIFKCSIDYIMGMSNKTNEIEEDKIEYAFSSGYNALNENNKNLINTTIEGLLLKQKEEQKKKK